MRFAGLADRKNDRAGTYSGGMQRRLNLACALVHDPPVLFVDAPLQGVQPPHPPLQLVNAVLELHPRVKEALGCRDVGELSDDVLAAVGELAQKILFALGHSSAFRRLRTVFTGSARA